MKSMTVGKKEQGFAVAEAKIQDTRVAVGAPQVATPRASKKQRRKDVIDRDYQIWRQELL